MSRNFEILEKADRSRELFGPLPAEVTKTVQEPGFLFDDRSGGGAGQLLDLVEVDPLRREVNQVPSLPLEPSARPGDWQQLGRYFFPLRDSALRHSVGICSAKDGQSTSTLMALLGERLSACVHSPLLLVEASFQRPALAEILGVPAAPGLREMLLDPARMDLECIHKSARERLWILPAGEGPDPQVTGDLENRFRRVYDTLCSRFSNLIIELPPPTDGNVVFPYALLDTVIVAVRPNSIGSRELQRAVRRLAGANANLGGSILNDLEPPSNGVGKSSWGSSIRSFLRGSKAR